MTAGVMQAVGAATKLLFGAGAAYESSRIAEGLKDIAVDDLGTVKKTTEQMMEDAKRDWGRYKEVYLPQLKGIAEKAGEKADTDRYEGTIAAEIAQRGKTAIDKTAYGLMSAGVGPSSGRFREAIGDVTDNQAALSAKKIREASTAAEKSKFKEQLGVGQMMRGVDTQMAQNLGKATDIVSAGARRAAGLSDAWGTSATQSLADLGKTFGQSPFSDPSNYQRWFGGGDQPQPSGSADPNAFQDDIGRTPSTDIRSSYNLNQPDFDVTQYGLQ